MYYVKENKPEDLIHETPFFSIIIVTFNCGETLPRTLNAIKKQTYRDYEIVLVDNGSTDNTDYIIKQFINKNKSINTSLFIITIIT